MWPRAVDPAIPSGSKYVVDKLRSNLMQAAEVCLAGEEDDSTSLTLFEKLRGTCEEDDCNLQVAGLKTRGSVLSRARPRTSLTFLALCTGSHSSSSVAEAQNN
jgi:hypothetical protein